MKQADSMIATTCFDTGRGNEVRKADGVGNRRESKDVKCSALVFQKIALVTS